MIQNFWEFYICDHNSVITRTWKEDHWKFR
jgi:hypothetical protein